MQLEAEPIPNRKLVGHRQLGVQHSWADHRQIEAVHKKFIDRKHSDHKHQVELDQSVG